MDFIDYLTAFLFVTQFLFFVVTDYFLFRKGIEKKMANVLILAAGFLIVTLAILFVILGVGTFDEMQNVYNFGILCIPVFIYATFYRKLHSHFRIFLISSITMVVIKIFSYNVFEEEGAFFYIDTLAQTFLIVIVFGYYGNASLRAYNIVKTQPVKEHVKKRLQIMGYASWFGIFGNLPIWIMEITLGTPYTDLKYGSTLVILLVTITSCTFAISMYLSWVMPNWFKTYLNRNMDPSSVSLDEHDDDDLFGKMSQEEKSQAINKRSSTNEMIAYLGSSLNEVSQISYIESNMFIRKAIASSLGEIPDHIRFREWLLILGEHLERLLTENGRDNPVEICGKLIGDLIQKQALVTMISI